ncbi:alpha/beta hydrolase [Corynebacterium epidermidicanis]|uniref:Alpha/beta hydrolase n=1 Tax=Corynebacterium epidermidicanis TaxID=1050174 RepID=A0A0G3GM33_9CORY|nr:alpha/beta hydrolase [Corynebacterium epidermidicanis]AKK02189.1 Alpha/beta hydrolase [Corynebacterium epidermidicanis]
MKLRSAELFDAARILNQTATQHQDVLHSTDFGANSGDAIDAARRREAQLRREQTQVVVHMRAVASVLDRTGHTMAYVESDLDRLVRRLDEATQDSSLLGKLFLELEQFSADLDAACAQEIRALCGLSVAEGHGLEDFPLTPLAEIHAELAATSLLDERFPDATLLPTRDGIVLAFGDIETAPAVATIVPGVGSADPDSWDTYAARARRAAAATGAAVLWIDYPAPSSVPAALSKAPAQLGAQRLAAFQAALANRAARKGNEPELIVLGHSYGSLVTGLAAKSGLVADAVVFAGSPGVGVSHSSELDLRTDHPRVVSTTSPHDPIGLTVGALGGVHGPDPASDGFGAQVWPAVGGHSSYLDSPEFYENLGQLARARQGSS